MTEAYKDSDLFASRYERLDLSNRSSWYMNEAERPFSVYMSVHSAGREKEVPDFDASDEAVEAIRKRNRAARSLAQFASGQFVRAELAGNVSVVRSADGSVPYGPGDMTDRGRYRNGLSNMRRFLEAIDVDIANVRILNPERRYDTPLTVVNIDEDPGRYEGGAPVLLKKSGDFIYTFNPNIVFRAGPADCPIAVFSADTPTGELHGLMHFAWRGQIAGQFDGMVRALEALNVNRESMRVYLTPGGHAETFTFEGYLPDGVYYPDVAPSDVVKNLQAYTDPEGNTRYSFAIDAPYAAYQDFMSMGLTPFQVFIDTSDTTDQRSGYASHSIASRRYGESGKTADDNVRDSVIAKFVQRPR